MLIVVFCLQDKMLQHVMCVAMFCVCVKSCCISVSQLRESICGATAVMKSKRVEQKMNLDKTIYFKLIV